MADMLKYARAYAKENGSRKPLPIFPLSEGQKTPLIGKKRGGNGCLDATTDLEQINKWWSACTVIFSPRKGVYQGVHSKKTYTSEHSAEIAERINHNKNDKKNVAKEKARKRLEKMAHAPENKNEEWAKEIRRREHIADYYANKNKSKK